MGTLVGCAVMPHPPIMIPEVGKDEVKKIANTVSAAEKAAELIQNAGPQTIVLITPHGPVCQDAVTISVHPRLRGSLANFDAPDVNLGFNCDIQLINQLLLKSEKLGINLEKAFISELDHGALVPLYYLHKAGFRGELVYLSIGLLPYEEMYTLGKVVQAVIQKSDKKVAVIASGDLSHRLTPDAPCGYHPEGELFDKKVVAVLESANVKDLLQLDTNLIENAGECGLRSIFFLLGVLGGITVKTDVLSYEGPFGVGYAVAHYSQI